MAMFLRATGLDSSVFSPTEMLIFQVLQVQTQNFNFFLEMQQLPNFYGVFCFSDYCTKPSESLTA